MIKKINIKTILYPIVFICIFLVAGLFVKYVAVASNQLVKDDEIYLVFMKEELILQAADINTETKRLYDWWLAHNQSLPSLPKENLMELKSKTDNAKRTLSRLRQNALLSSDGTYTKPYHVEPCDSIDILATYTALSQLQYTYSKDFPKLLVDEQGKDLTIDEFKENYCNRPLLIALINNHKKSLQVAQCELNYLNNHLKKYVK